MAAAAKRQSPSPLYHTEQIHLARFGQTAQSTDGAELVKAFEMVNPGEYDAILMDIQMPHMNGYEATTAIRAAAIDRPDLAQIPIIALSADAFAEDVKHAHSVGMNDHMAKPMEIESLVAIMRKWMPKGNEN